MFLALYQKSRATTQTVCLPAQLEAGSDELRDLAPGVVNQSRSVSTLVSRCLENHICGEKPSSIRCELERIAQMNPEEIKETLLEALEAGLGHETISVKASEEAIAEANLALPEELKLQVR